MIVDLIGAFFVIYVVPTNTEMVDMTYNSTHILANWSEPNFSNGLLKYRINISSTPLLKSEEAAFIVQNMVTIETAVQLKHVVIFFTRYEITVEPFTREESGDSVTDSFETEQGGMFFRFL